MAKIVKLKIPLIFFSEFCPSNNSKPVLILIVTQEKRLGVNIWPIIGIIKPRSWPKLSGTYGTCALGFLSNQNTLIQAYGTRSFCHDTA